MMRYRIYNIFRPSLKDCVTRGGVEYSQAPFTTSGLHLLGSSLTVASYMNVQRRHITKDHHGTFAVHERLVYYKDVVKRVLPNMEYFTQGEYARLAHDPGVVKYFKKIRLLQEYPNLANCFRKFGFDLSLYYRVLKESKSSQLRFFDKVRSCHDMITSKDMAADYKDITSEELKFLEHRLDIDLDLSHNIHNFEEPCVEDVLNHVNYKASQGLPEPRIRKRDILPLLRDILVGFHKTTLHLSDIILYPTATFCRLQIKSKGLKERVVHAVQASISILESHFYLWFMTGLPKSSAIKIGLTQLEISDFVTELTPYNTYCFDYSKWDHSRKQVLSVISFDIISRCLRLTAYKERIFKFLRNYYLTVPMFHPTIGFATRHMGTVSGSGFTSLDNSMCNYIMFTICFHRYCIKTKLDPYAQDVKIGVCGDDLVFGCMTELNGDDFTVFCSEQFGVSMGQEMKIQRPNINKCFFLGSKWIDGKPYREERVMVASVIFGTGNFPKMSTYELFTSRFLQVFGNTADCDKFWDRLGVSLPGRVFSFEELKVFSDPARGVSSPRSNVNRGSWGDVNLRETDLSRLWEQR